MDELIPLQALIYLCIVLLSNCGIPVCSSYAVLLKIGFLQITLANLNASGQNFTGIYRQNSNLALTFWRPGPKGHKMAVKSVGVFCNGCNELAFLCTGTDRHEIRAKTSSIEP